MAIKTALRSVGGSAVILGLMSGSALAGSPAYCGVAGCDAGTAVVQSPRGFSGPATVENRTPYDFLDSVHFQRSPHTSITRVHGRAPTMNLSDSPVGFTQGCHPQSTAYCRTGGQASASASATASATGSANAYASASSGSVATTRPYTGPIISAPTVTAPTYTPAPTYYAPTSYSQASASAHSYASAPARIVATGGGFDPSKFTPRIYGDPYTITPGIAYLPTSVVDRNPYRAQAVLDAGPGGVTPALSGMPIGPLPTPRPYGWSSQMMGQQSGNVMMQRPVMNMQRPVMSGPMMQPRIVQAPQIQAPFMRPMMMRPPVMRAPMPYPSIPTGYPGAAGAPYKMSGGRYGSTVGADGTYWEKVSGPTRFGNTVATQVICKRKLPHQPTPYPAPYPMPPAPCGVKAKGPGRY